MNQPSGKHLLIVDDYDGAVDVWAAYLQARGYRVATAVNGLSAVEKAMQLLPDLIVLDLELPGLSGFEVAQRLRAFPGTSGIPLIAATGHSHGRQLDLARRSGFDAVVVKPCNPDALVQEIERLLSNSSGGVQLGDLAGEQPDTRR